MRKKLGEGACWLAILREKKRPFCFLGIAVFFG
jgi:hypothetical protein